MFLLNGQIVVCTQQGLWASMAMVRSKLFLLLVRDVDILCFSTTFMFVPVATEARDVKHEYLFSVFVFY